MLAVLVTVGTVLMIVIVLRLVVRCVNGDMCWLMGHVVHVELDVSSVLPVIPLSVLIVDHSSILIKVVYARSAQLDVRIVLNTKEFVLNFYLDTLS